MRQNKLYSLACFIDLLEYSLPEDRFALINQYEVFQNNFILYRDISYNIDVFHEDTVHNTVF